MLYGVAFWVYGLTVTPFAQAVCIHEKHTLSRQQWARQAANQKPFDKRS